MSIWVFTIYYFVVCIVSLMVLLKKFEEINSKEKEIVKIYFKDQNCNQININCLNCFI